MVLRRDKGCYLYSNEVLLSFPVRSTFRSETTSETESPLNMTKYVFYFMLKAVAVLEILIFCLEFLVL